MGGGGYVCVWGGGRGSLKIVLLARNLTLNSNAAPNYKHVFGALRGPLSFLQNVRVKHS